MDVKCAKIDQLFESIATRAHLEILYICRYQHKRHRFAICTLEFLYRKGADVEHPLLAQATYRSHVDVVGAQPQGRHPADRGGRASRRREGAVRCRLRVGGMLRYYYRQAA